MQQIETREAKRRQLVPLAFWTFAGSLLTVVMPAEIVLFIIIPAFLWREILRIHRHCFLPGAALRYPIIVGVVAVAVMAPTKYEDTHIGPVSTTSPTLAELRTAEAF